MNWPNSVPVVVHPSKHGFQARCVLIAECRAFGLTREKAIAEICKRIADRLERDIVAREYLPATYEVIHVPIEPGTPQPPSRR
jgi:hypothetical protein